MGKGSPKVNNNYIHSCDSTKFDIKKHKALITSCYEPNELKEIFRFYVLEAPILNQNKTSEAAGPRSLKELGWSGTQQLNKLEHLLLASSGLGTFAIMKSKSITETLKTMNLDDTICIEHPRCVICKPPKDLYYNEDGSLFENQKNENRMQCLFRHIRNGIAHSLTYAFENEMILLEDRSDDRDCITAKILIHQKTLLDWIQIVETQGDEKQKADASNIK